MGVMEIWTRPCLTKTQQQQKPPIVPPMTLLYSLPTPTATAPSPTPITTAPGSVGDGLGATSNASVVKGGVQANSPRARVTSALEIALASPVELFAGDGGAAKERVVVPGGGGVKLPLLQRTGQADGGRDAVTEVR